MTFCSTRKIISPDHYLSSLPMLTRALGSKKKKAKGSFKVTFNDRKGLKVITKHLKEQVNFPRRKITGDSS